jgi:hypothetical protein
MEKGEAVTSPLWSAGYYFTVKYFSGTSIWVEPM